MNLLATHETGEKHRKKVFDPQKGFMKSWDLVVAAALFVTATVTPFEIGFLSTEINALFVLNRGIDIIFICDVYVNLHLAYFDKTRGWIYDPQKCMRRCE